MCTLLALLQGDRIWRRNPSLKGQNSLVYTAKSNKRHRINTARAAIQVLTYLCHCTHIATFTHRHTCYYTLCEHTRTHLKINHLGQRERDGSVVKGTDCLAEDLVLVPSPHVMAHNYASFQFQRIFAGRSMITRHTCGTHAHMQANHSHMKGKNKYTFKNNHHGSLLSKAQDIFPFYSGPSGCFYVTAIKNAAAVKAAWSFGSLCMLLCRADTWEQGTTSRGSVWVQL